MQGVEFEKRAWNSHFNGGLGKRAFLRLFSTVLLKNKFLTQGVEFEKRAWNSHFNGGLGKRAWNSQFNGGLGI